MMPRLEKGPASARLAQSKMKSVLTPGSVAGRPMPICIMSSNLFRVLSGVSLENIQIKFFVTLIIGQLAGYAIAQ